MFGAGVCFNSSQATHTLHKEEAGNRTAPVLRFSTRDRGVRLLIPDGDAATPNVTETTSAERTPVTTAQLAVT